MLRCMIDEQVLEQRLAALEAVRAWSPRVVSRLEALIRSGEESALFRVNPLRFAAERGIAEAEAVDLFLHAAANGLFLMDWLLICPMCACVAESLAGLHGVGDHYHCPVCRVDHTSILDEYIAVAFTVAPSVRPIAFHRPRELSAEDYCFGYRMTADGIMPDGQPIAVHLRQAAQGVAYLPPGAVTRFEVESEGGLYLGWDVETNAYLEYRIAGAPLGSPQTLRIRYGETGCSPSEGEMAPGKAAFEIENATAERHVLVLCLLPPGLEHAAISFAPFLKAARLLATQTFRDLFRSELVRASEGIGVREATLLFTDLKGSTALYERIGDLNAFALVQRHFERLLDVTVRHQGAVIKTLGDAVMAAFQTPADAVAAAIAMREEIGRFNTLQPGQDLILKIGIHSGPSIAVTLNERLDYFGQTVNIAARVQGVAGGDEICFTRDVFAASGVETLIAPYALAQGQARLRGLDQEMPVYRIGAKAA